MPRVRFQQNAKKKCGAVKVAEYDPDVLKNKLEAYVKSVGVNKAFDLHSYKSLPVSYAARGNDLVKLHKWVMAILTVNPRKVTCLIWFFFRFDCNVLYMHPKKSFQSMHQKPPRLKIVETRRSLKDLAITYPAMRKLGGEKSWAQNTMERFGVV